MQISCRTLLPIVLFLLLPSVLWAQQVPSATLTGTVVDDSTGTPLAGAHVFIAVSMNGTTTDEAGRYRLDRVPLGAHRLYVTTVGFEPEARDVVLRQAGEQRFDFRLRPMVVEVGEVVVEAKENKRWRQQLEKFTRLFIGETPYAGQTKILNPEVLDFEDQAIRFTARASEPLVIENQALGYRIRYFLKEFGASTSRTWYDGEPLYEEMTPDSPAQAAMWEANRRKAFLGSFRHFMLALLAGRVEEQGFLTYSRPDFRMNDEPSGPAGPGGLPGQSIGFQGGHRFPVKPDEIFSDGPTPNDKVLDFHGAVEIIYQGEMEDPSYLQWGGSGRRGGKPKFQTSMIYLSKGPALVDYKGDPHDPYGVTFMGYLAFERVADELPKEYRPRG